MSFKIRRLRHQLLDLKITIGRMEGLENWNGESPNLFLPPGRGGSIPPTWCPKQLLEEWNKWKIGKFARVEN